MTAAVTFELARALVASVAGLWLVAVADRWWSR